MSPDALSPNDVIVLRSIRSSTRPVSAYDIVDMIRPERPRIAPTTVYRALHRLAAAGLVDRIETLNAWFARPDSMSRKAGILAICDDCGTVDEFAAPDALTAIDGALGATGFLATRPVIEVHGRCGPCDEGRA